jgi:hypothetical protein
MNKKILEQGTLEIKRFFALDERAYESGSFPGQFSRHEMEERFYLSASKKRLIVSGALPSK